MKKLLLPLAIAAALAAPGIASADEAAAKSNGCLKCHSVDKKLVGPAFKDVAKKYTEADVPKLVEKVKKGGVGVWGQVPMPPNAQVSDEDIEKIVRWILTLK